MAQQNLAHELAKIFSRQANIAAQEGAYTAGEAEKLQNAYNKEQATERRDLRKEEGAEKRNERTVNAAIEGHHLAHPGGPGATKPQTQHEQSIASSAVATMMKRLEASGLRGEGQRGAMVKKLMTTRPEQSVEVEPGVKTKVPKVPGYPAGPQMEAAIDQYIYGYVGPKHTKELQTQGYTLSELGLTEYNPSYERPRGPASGVSGSSAPSRRR